MLDYKLIEAFAVVITEGGFDKAASKLHITQSAISQRIKLLEDQTGQVLVVRSSPPSATPAGTQLLKHYMQVKRLEDELHDTLHLSAEEGSFHSLPIGINADSLATWFFPVMDPFLKKMKITLDLHVDDQEETHKLLRDGEVAGCISSRNTPVQGCSLTHIGNMIYRLVATPAFIEKYFKKGFNFKSAQLAPAVIFNRKDNLHYDFFKIVFDKNIKDFPTHYVPSSEKFCEFIAEGYGYGMLPDLQAGEKLKRGELIDLLPDHRMNMALYWHSWNLKSGLLESFSEVLNSECKRYI